jgi:hypothetical protein
MSVPKFTAETSLYKSIRSYGGYSGRTKLDTTSSVEAAWWGIPPFIPCLLGCEIARANCISNCQSPPPTPHPIGCKFGEKCCERDQAGNCRVCVSHNMECP